MVFDHKIHLHHKITCLPLKILTFVKKLCVLGPRINIAKNMDPLRVQKCFQRTPFITLIFINFFVYTAKRPSSQFGKNKKLFFFPFFIPIHTSKTWTQCGSNALEPMTILRTKSNGLFERSNFSF